MSSMVPDDAPRPRLCHLEKSPEFVGYGFNLHAEKGKAGQFIGDVDPGSPAALADLCRGDRIVEVNNTNIANENHQQVVQRVKAIANETKLLVVDAETDRYYREKKIVIRGDMPNVLRLPAGGGDYTDGDGINITVKPADDTPTNNNINEAVHQTTNGSLDVRLCRLHISPDFNGYGFNLHSEKGKAGQYIGSIDPGSPAEAAGLRQGDRIIEVNEFPINEDEHKQVVQKIKLNPNKTQLLVVDADTDRWYKQENVLISGALPNVKVIDSSEHVTENDVVTEAEMNHSSSSNQVSDVEVNSIESTEPTEYKSEERVSEVEVNSIESTEPTEYKSEERMNGDANREHDEVQAEFIEVVTLVEDSIEDNHAIADNHVAEDNVAIEDNIEDNHTVEDSHIIVASHAIEDNHAVEESHAAEDNHAEPERDEEEEIAPPTPPAPEPEAPVYTEIEPPPPVVTESEPASPTLSHEPPVSPSLSQYSYNETSAPAPSRSDSNNSGGSLEGEVFSMSVKEARARIGGRKKRNEVKQSGMSSKAKYDLFQKL